MVRSAFEIRVQKTFCHWKRNILRPRAPQAVFSAVLIAQTPHSDTSSPMHRSAVCAQTRAEMRSLLVAPREHPLNIKGSECVCFVSVDVHPTSIVRCVCMYRVRLSSNFGRQTLRSVRVTVAAVDLSRLFLGLFFRISTDFTIAPRLSSLFGSTAACLSVHPHPPNSAHAPYTYQASDIDQPRG